MAATISAAKEAVSSGAVPKSGSSARIASLRQLASSSSSPGRALSSTGSNLISSVSDRMAGGLGLHRSCSGRGDGASFRRSYFLLLLAGTAQQEQGQERQGQKKDQSRHTWHHVASHHGSPCITIYFERSAACISTIFGPILLI